MTIDTVSIKVEPEPRSVALIRVFVSNVLALFGVSDRDFEDVKIAVSDLATGLVEEGQPISVEALLDRDELVLRGNSAVGTPETGKLLLGSRFRTDETGWVITLRQP